MRTVNGLGAEGLSTEDVVAVVFTEASREAVRDGFVWSDEAVDFLRVFASSLGT